MDGRHFDELTRNLAKGSSRRSLLKGLIGGGAAIVAAKSGATIAAPPQGKVDICHFDEELGHRIVINVATNAQNAHLAHGDWLYEGAECCADSECDDGDACTIDTCEQGTCSNVAIDCSDGYGCTNDTCVDGECVHTPNHDYCADDFACTNHRCQPDNDGANEEGCVYAVDHDYCADGNECTDDRCAPEATNRPGYDAVTGCVNSPRTDASCDDDTGTCDATGACIPNCVEPASCTADSQCCAPPDRICVRVGGGAGAEGRSGACRDFCLVNGVDLAIDDCAAPDPEPEAPTTGTNSECCSGVCSKRYNRAGTEILAQCGG